MGRTLVANRWLAGSACGKRQRGWSLNSVVRRHKKMIRELGETRQEPGGRRRRWFASPYCDLILWLNDDESLWGFQLCYDKPENEHALTWIQDAGFSHMAVDTGGANRRGKGAPLLVPNGVYDAHYIRAVFERESGEVPSEYNSFIVAKIGELEGARDV